MWPIATWHGRVPQFAVILFTKEIFWGQVFFMVKREFLTVSDSSRFLRITLISKRNLCECDLPETIFLSLLTICKAGNNLLRVVFLYTTSIACAVSFKKYWSQKTWRVSSLELTKFVWEDWKVLFSKIKCFFLQIILQSQMRFFNCQIVHCRMCACMWPFQDE